MKVVLIGIGVLAIIGGLIVGSWQLGWWATAYSVNKTAHIYNNSYGRQSALVDQVNSQIQDVYNIDSQMASPQTPASEVSALQAQKKNEISLICSEAAQINQQPQNIQTFYVQNNCQEQ